MRLVLDTDVLVSALLVGAGAGTASQQVLRLCLEGTATPLMGAALFAECEDVLGRDGLFECSPVSASERQTVVDVLMSACMWTPIYYPWRPSLPDAGDDHLIELALAGGAAWIVTANVRDLGRGEPRIDDLRIGTAGDFLDHYDEQGQETNDECDDDPAS